MVYVCLCGLWHCFTNMWHFENRWLFHCFTEPWGWISPGLAKPSRCDLLDHFNGVIFEIFEERPGRKSLAEWCYAWFRILQDFFQFNSGRILQETSFWINVPVYIYNILYIYVCTYMLPHENLTVSSQLQSLQYLDIVTSGHCDIRGGLFQCPPSGATGWLSWIISSWSSCCRVK